jgi:hypothetical protein
VVRPDRFVFALVPGQQLAQVTREFARQMHRDQALAQAPVSQTSTSIHTLPQAA